MRLAIGGVALGQASTGSSSNGQRRQRTVTLPSRSWWQSCWPAQCGVTDGLGPESLADVTIGVPLLSKAPWASPYPSPVPVQLAALLLHLSQDWNVSILLYTVQGGEKPCWSIIALYVWSIVGTSSRELVSVGTSVLWCRYM